MQCGIELFTVDTIPTKSRYFWSLIIHTFWSPAISNQEHTFFQIFMEAVHYRFFLRVTVFSSQDQDIKKKKKNGNLTDGLWPDSTSAKQAETVEAFLTITLFRIFLCEFLLCCGFLHTQALSRDRLHRFAADDGTVLTWQPTASNHSNKEQW